MSLSQGRYSYDIRRFDNRAGCTGAYDARLLSEYNCSVAVADMASDVATGATAANSAIVHAGYDAKSGTLKAKLNVRGNRLMKELAAQLGVELKNVGSHVIGFGDSDLVHLKELYKRGVDNGVEGLEIISGDKLREMEPNVSRGSYGVSLGSDGCNNLSLRHYQ